MGKTNTKSERPIVQMPPHIWN